jgi:hypothetical protein
MPVVVKKRSRPRGQKLSPTKEQVKTCKRDYPGDPVASDEAGVDVRTSLSQRLALVRCARLGSAQIPTACPP